MITFILFMAFLISLRFLELIHSKRNEIWLLQNGAIEYGHSHYFFIIAIHTLFIISLVLEFFYRKSIAAEIFQLNIYNKIFLISFVILTICKICVVANLGKFWNTKIYKIPKMPPIKSGVYKFVKHPNYMIVVLEIIVIPLSFNLYFSAIIFSIFNAIVLKIRISEENKVLYKNN